MRCKCWFRPNWDYRLWRKTRIVRICRKCGMTQEWLPKYDDRLHRTEYHWVNNPTIPWKELEISRD